MSKICRANYEWYVKEYNHALAPLSKPKKLKADLALIRELSTHNYDKSPWILPIFGRDLVDINLLNHQIPNTK